MPELLDELAPAFGEPKIFRPYRDVRFSKDKSPYKTNIGAVVGDGYIQLSASGLAAGTGMYGMAPDQLDRYRLAGGRGATRPEPPHGTSRVGRAPGPLHGGHTPKTPPQGHTADEPRRRPP